LQFGTAARKPQRTGLRPNKNAALQPLSAINESGHSYSMTSSAVTEEMRTMLAEGRIRLIKIETDVRVHTAWDLGVSDSTAIWFVQCVGRERRLVDYYEGSGVGLDHYAQVLHDKRIQHGFVPVLNNVRYASDSDHSRYESELTLWADSRHQPSKSISYT
jgi:hypothetical protein